MTAGSIYKDGTYLDRHPTWHEEDSPWKARQIAKLLARNRLRPATIAEVGCGAGGILESLAREQGDGVSFTGYEISPQAYARCKPRERANLAFYNRDPFAGSEPRFDVLMAIDVIEHVEDYLDFLRKMRERAVYKIYHIPLDLSVVTVLRSKPLLKCRAASGHLHYFMKATALAALTDTGHELLDCFYTKGALELPDRGWPERLLNLPRRLLFPLHRDLTASLFGGFSLMVLAR